jgi:hypothetical protein
MKLEQSASVNDDLKKEQQAKEEVLQSKDEDMEEMVSAVIELIETLNQEVQGLCGLIKDVSTCKLEVSSTFTEVP